MTPAGPCSRCAAHVVRSECCGLDVLRSDDSRPFEALGAAFGPPTGADVGSIRRVGSGWLAVLGTYESSTLWGSDDGRSFKRLTDTHSPFAHAAVSDVAVLGPTIVLVGGVPRHRFNSPAYRATAWLHRLAAP